MYEHLTADKPLATLAGRATTPRGALRATHLHLRRQMYRQYWKHPQTDNIYFFLADPRCSPRL
ncbi:MAG: hypothetical protein IPL51_13120 [Candidatus Competibacteraceae bacterium]|nr:hypothetical protein [Candidatus Competibacteraceae bacterium]